jgi:GDPmannose 4,6-dehydratase
VGRIAVGLQQTLFLGNLDARRDWGFAGDYVEAMWRMVQQDEPDDYVVATGTSYSVRDMLEVAFGAADLDWEQYVQFDARYLRPTEVDHLEGDASRAAAKLGWTPTTGFRALIEMMVRHDLSLARRELLLVENGHVVPTPAAFS